LKDRKEKNASVAGFWGYCIFIVLRQRMNTVIPSLATREMPSILLFFMNVQKYRLHYCYGATVGIGILFLAFVGNVKNGLTKFITVMSRPFLYYILHFFLIHLVSAICYLSRGHSLAEGLKTQQGGFVPQFWQREKVFSFHCLYDLDLCRASLYPVCNGSAI